jgi:galactosylxylosylprotein 3-beta-galactosyltransferase
VGGEPPDAAAAAALAAEEAEAGGGLFLRVAGVRDRYDELPKKTAAFLAAALADAPDALYILKVDDDVFVRLDRVPAAVSQWGGLAGGKGADAVGCAKNGPVFADPALRWHEPAAPLLGENYYTHYWGPAYALSASAAATIVDFTSRFRPRFLANEDTTLGLWLLALDAAHYDDRRLCSPACDASAVAVYDYPECAGLCDPARQLRELAATCVGGGTEPPLVPELIPMNGL